MKAKEIINTVVGGLLRVLVLAVGVLVLGRMAGIDDDPGPPETWMQPVAALPAEPRVVYMPNPERLTRDSLKRDYGIELVCHEQVKRYGTGNPINYGETEAVMACSRVVGLKIRAGSGVEWIEKDGRRLR